jgi:hypothetical protein
MVTDDSQTLDAGYDNMEKLLFHPWNHTMKRLKVTIRHQSKMTEMTFDMLTITSLKLVTSKRM